MALTRQLYELQELDTDIEHTRQTLDLKTSQVGKRDALDAALARLTAEQKNLEECKHQRRDAEFELEDIASKISAAEKQLYSGKITNSKELSNLQHEINTFKALSDKGETKTLEIIDRLEIAEQTVAAAIAEYQKLEAEWQQLQIQLAADIALLQKTHTDLVEKRRQFVAQIEPPAISLYESVRRKKTPAVARLEQGICCACRISQSASTLQKARGGQPVQCGSCGRILFIS
jgi:predicted  nucleic acid-binding Zn-ribbon protein